MFIKTILLKVKFGKPIEVLIDKSHYLHKNMQNSLVGTTRNGEKFAVFSINLVEEKQNKNEIFIKDYSENSGFMEQLIQHGLISKPKRIIEKEFVDIYVCDLLK